MVRCADMMGKDKFLDFYENLAEHYHLIFDDWDRAIERQASVLNPLLSSLLPNPSLKILDCACGIGTQVIGFAKAGHQVVGSDLSLAAITRARREAALRGLDIRFYVSDMTSLSEISETDFDVVTAIDNALPHLTAAELSQALRALRTKLNPGGVFLASIRDYDRIVAQKPTTQEPAFHGEAGERRIVHQVWDWIDGEHYLVHLYITALSGGRWQNHHFVSRYRSLSRDALSASLRESGFEQIRWLMPDESGFYQPLVVARKASK